MSKGYKIDLTGTRYSRLVAIKYSRTGSGYKGWECMCDCGNTVVVHTQSLRRGLTKSCGCLQQESRTKHGKYKTLEYNTWRRIKSRCVDKSKHNYYLYGGRGIKVCDRWVNSFENFLEDMGERPSKDHSIDRIDNDGDYSPENCRWATKQQQIDNKRNSITINYKGKKLTPKQAAAEYGLNAHTLRGRVRRGWSCVEVIEGKKRT